MPIEIGAIGVSVGVELIKRTAPSGIAVVRTWIGGQKVLILGPARAGKTSFYDYLRYGVLEHEQETEKTVETEKSATFSVRIGRDSALELKVRGSFDVPGQLGPIEHALIAKKKKPNGIVVILDSSSPASGGAERSSRAWLVEFCKHLDEHLRQTASFRNRLRALVFVANKVDKISEEKAARIVSSYRATIQKHLAYSYSTKVEAIPVLPCVLVQGSAGAAMADAVIVRLAKALKK